MRVPASTAAIGPGALAALLAAIGLLNSFASDMFLPALRSVARELDATPVQTQQAVSLFFLACAFMSLWHGAIADAWGRRRTLLACLAVLVAASLACLAVRGMGELWAIRVVQGMAAGAGVVLSRAIVLDLHRGLAAQRLLGRITAIQTLAPIATPLAGGWITLAFGWRGVFVALAAIAALLALAVLRWLPETLPPERRQPLLPARLARSYLEVLGSRPFLRLALAHAANWGSMILYVVSAPAFVMGPLQRDETGVWLVFAPIMLGLLAGFALLPAVVRRHVDHPALRAAYATLAAAVALNLALGALLPAGLHNLLPLFVQSVGVALAMPSLVGMALEPFGERMGVASSCHTFLQFAATAAIAGVLAPLVWRSAALLALGSAALTAAGALALWRERARVRALRPSGAARRSR